MVQDEAFLNRITEQIIGCSYRIGKHFGQGFLEKVYENSLKLEIQKTGLQVEQQKPIRVLYDGQSVGEFFADLIVENEILVELKAVKALDNVHFSQCMNYLKATGKKICLLINFGASKVEIRRVVNNL